MRDDDACYVPQRNRIVRVNKREGVGQRDVGGRRVTQSKATGHVPFPKNGEDFLSSDYSSERATKHRNA